jgi:hypothetical protein
LDADLDAIRAEYVSATFPALEAAAKALMSAIEACKSLRNEEKRIAIKRVAMDGDGVMFERYVRLAAPEMPSLATQEMAKRRYTPLGTDPARWLAFWRPKL